MSTTDLDPTEFVQSGRRLFIDTNIFMDNRSRWSGGLKRLFERTAATIVEQKNPIVVPTKVVRELEKYAGKHSSRVAEEQVEAVRRSRVALTFLEDAEARGLVRTDLGDDSARYADDSFLKVVEWAGGRYEMCVITDDITLQLRIRLRSAQLVRRLTAGTLTSDGLVAIDDDQVLYGRGARKLDAKQQKVDDGTATFADRQDVEELTALLPEFQATFSLKPWTKQAPRAASTSGGPPPRRASAPQPEHAFSANSPLREPDQLLPQTALPGEGDEVQVDSARNHSRVTLGKLLGEGGEGRVYEVLGQPNRVIKVLDAEHRTEHRQAKIKLLTSRPLIAKGIGFPVATISNTDGAFVGYSMPRASGKELQATVMRPARFRATYPDWTKGDLVDVCISFLEKVSYLHSLNILLGDINPKNLMVNANKDVWIIDADSWQLEGYPCPVGTPMFTAPTMNGEYADRLRTPEEELFAVAVMLFMILITGQHPYNRAGTDGDITRLIEEKIFPYQLGERKGADQPEGQWKYMWSHLHPRVKTMFWHTFHGDGDRYDKRPTADDWLRIFQEYKRYLTSPENFDPQSDDVYPTRLKAMAPDTPIYACAQCGASMIGRWQKDKGTYWTPKLCDDCRQNQSKCSECGKHKPAESLKDGRCWECNRKLNYAACSNCGKETPKKYLIDGRCSNCQLVACKDCGTLTAKTALTYGRCADCVKKAAELDPTRLCIDCRQPFITRDHVGWFQSKYLDVPRSHTAIKQSCPPRPATAQATARPPRAATPASTTPVAEKSLWTRLADWFKS